MKGAAIARKRRERRAGLRVLPSTPIASTIDYLIRHRSRFGELTVIGRDAHGVRVLTTTRSPLELHGLLGLIQHELLTGDFLDPEEGAC